MSAKRKYAEEFYGITPSKYSQLEDRHRKVLDVLSRYKLNRLLDIGCGDGNFTVLMARVCGTEEIYGVDVSERAVELARAKGIKCYRVDVDTEKLPFSDNFFDAITALEVIEHLFDPDHFLEEVRRVLKPGGLFILSTPNLASIHNRIALLLGYQPFPTSVSARMNIGRLYEPDSKQSLDHIRLFTLRSLKELLRIHEFKIIEIKGSSASLPRNIKFRRILGAIDELFSSSPSLSYRVIVVARK